jgi:hypothetical protein
MGGAAVLLGDTIKTVKPYFGLGVNSVSGASRAVLDSTDQSL